MAYNEKVCTIWIFDRNWEIETIAKTISPDSVVVKPFWTVIILPSKGYAEFGFPVEIIFMKGLERFLDTLHCQFWYFKAKFSKILKFLAVFANFDNFSDFIMYACHVIAKNYDVE